MDFQKEVIEASKEQPIVVDFWAPWCGPCKSLGPLLEEMDEAQDRWKLVKVNVDENRDISTQYSIRSIPEVKMFVNGEIKDGFTGSLPKHEIEKWLIKNIPDERLDVLQELISAAENDNSHLDKLEGFIRENPDLKQGQIALAKLILFDNPEYALKLVSGIMPGTDHFDLAESMKQITHFLTVDIKADKGIGSKLNEAKILLAENKPDLALPLIIEAVVIDKSFMNDLPRKTAIGIFNYLGNDHELTRAHRRQFDMSLY